MRAKEFLTELGYKGNIGMMEMVKFMQVATPEQKALMKQLIQAKKTDEAWKLLQDVTGVKLNEYEEGTDNSKQIFAQLKQAGYKMLGGGVDSTVWTKDEGEVLKVLMPSDIDNKANSEMSFLIFHDACKEMKGNPHVPKFVDQYSVFEINGTDYMQITMEKLYPLQKGSTKEAIVWGLSWLCQWPNITWEGALKEMRKPDFWLDFPRRVNTDQILPFLDSYELLFQTMQAFHKLAKSGDMGWDLHTENVMQRKDGTLVITDPYLE